MNSSMLKRLFRTISPDQDPDQVKLAHEIIELERSQGHTVLAKSLETILAKSQGNKVTKKQLDKGKLISLQALPFDKRYKIPLVTHVERDLLRHEMILPSDTEEKIARIEEEYAAKERLKHFGLQPRQKILLHGAPGCGKSMTAERIAWNLGLPFLKVKFEAILSSFLGESATNIKAVFDSVKSSPCVLLLDEFDFIGKTRSSGNDVGEMHRVVNVLLQLMEEYDAPGILIATTNLEASLDSALFRRFDDIIELSKPGENEIKAMLQTTLSAIEIQKGLKLNEFGKKLDGYSPAMIVKVAQDAAKSAVLRNELPLTLDHLMKALKDNHGRSE